MLILVVAGGRRRLCRARADWAADRARRCSCSSSRSSATRFRLEFRGIRVSGSFLALVLAMALLGPAPAVVIGVAATLVDAVLYAAGPGTAALDNLAVYATFPLVGGLLIERAAASRRRVEDALGVRRARRASSS